MGNVTTKTTGINYNLAVGGSCELFIVNEDFSRCHRRVMSCPMLLFPPLFLWRPISLLCIQQMRARMATFWPPAYVQTWHEGVEKTRRQNYVFLLDTPQAEYLVGQRPCDLYTTDAFLRRRTYAFALRRGDRLKERVNAELFRLREAEEMDLLYMKWWRNECVGGGGRKVSARQSRDRTTVPNPWRFATAASAGVGNGVDIAGGSAASLLVAVVLTWTVGS